MVVTIIAMALVILFIGYKWYRASELIQTLRGENVEVEKNLKGALKEIKSHIDINFRLTEKNKKLTKQPSTPTEPKKKRAPRKPRVKKD